MSESDWSEVSVTASPASADELEAWLFAAGAVSVTYRDNQDQPILEPAPGEMRLWDEVVLIGLFAQATDTDSLHSALHLAAAANVLQPPAYNISVLADAVWERAWMQDYHPMQFGPRLWVCPSHRSPPDPDAINIMLDPGLAFGTGTHATTAQCLNWLGKNTGDVTQPLRTQSVIDFGCGSGLLAIAAVMLGADAVQAVDIDPQALLATRQNADANGALEKIRIGLPSALTDAPVDLLIANILFEPLHQLAEEFAQRIRAGGSLVMSGVLDEQVPALRMRYNQWFEFEPNAAQNGWSLLAATRRTEDLDGHSFHNSER